MKKILRVLCIAVVFIASCDDDDGSPATVEPSTDIFENTSVNYTLRFETGFTQDMFPTDYPNDPTFGTIVIITHSPEVSVFELGELASNGLMAYAEDGDVNALGAAISNGVGDGNEGSFSLATETSIGPSSLIDIDVTLTPTRSRITFLAKLNPSPDWFVGVSSFDIIDGNDLVSEAVFSLTPIDAGTAGGSTYLAPDEMQTANVTLYQGLPFVDGPFTANIATITLSRNF